MAQDPGELFDVCDQDGRPLGVQKPRGLVHRDGDWHRSIHVWVVLGPPQEPLVLFQQRAFAKDTWPGALDVAVTGHLSAGETSTDALREADEEIGLVLRAEDVRRLGLRKRADEHAPGILDRELQEIFGVVATQHLGAFRPAAAEVTCLVALPFEGVGALFRREQSSVRGTKLSPGGAIEEVHDVTLRAFIPDADGYYARAHESLRALLRGQSPPAWTL